MTKPRQFSVSQLHDLLEHVTHGVAMFEPDGRLIVWNGRLEELLEISPAELAQAGTLEGLIRFMGERGDYGADSDLDAVVREHVEPPEEPCVSERMLPDGRILEFRRHRAANGAVVVTYTDLSERRHTEYLLQDATREMRNLLEKAPVALAVIGQEDGVLKHVNARFRKLFGLSEAKSAAQMALGLYVSDQDGARILSAPMDRRSVDFETAVRRADGGEFWALISSVRFIFDWEPATLTSFHDITDRRRAEAHLQAELDRKRAELEEARTLQLELAPPPLRGRFGNFDMTIDVVLEPAKEVGGDLVDYFQVGDDLFVIALGDVSNKGAGAALMMARAHSLIRGIASHPHVDAIFRSPEKAIALVNAALSKDNATCMFLTLFLASFDARTGDLAYVRAGQVAPFLRRGGGPVTRLDREGGLPLGISEDARYKSSADRLAPGDRLLIVTDGITAAADPADAEFGEARVEAYLARLAPQEKQPLASLVREVRAFEAGRPAFDDVAAILLDLGAGVGDH